MTWPSAILHDAGGRDVDMEVVHSLERSVVTLDSRVNEACQSGGHNSDSPISFAIAPEISEASSRSALTPPPMSERWCILCRPFFFLPLLRVIIFSSLIKATAVDRRRSKTRQVFVVVVV